MKKHVKTVYTLSLALSAILLLQTPVVHAEEASQNTDLTAQTGGSFFFPLPSIIKNLFKKNVDEKKGNLEKNRDIRNKIIEEQAPKAALNIKFNQTKGVKYDISATSTDPSVLKLTSNIAKLTSLKARIDGHIKSLNTKELDTKAAQDWSDLAQAKLDDASFSIDQFTLATTTDAKKAILNTAFDDIHQAQKTLLNATDVLETTIDSLSATTSSLENLDSTEGQN